MTSNHDRASERIAPDGQEIVTVEGPSEIASWFFPHEPEEDDLRAALRTAIEDLLDRRIAELAPSGPGLARSVDRAC
jgi:hypothetical protein